MVDDFDAEACARGEPMLLQECADYSALCAVLRRRDMAHPASPATLAGAGERIFVAALHMRDFVTSAGVIVMHRAAAREPAQKRIASVIREDLRAARHLRLPNIVGQ
jgi:hypothetical protein